MLEGAGDLDTWGAMGSIDPLGATLLPLSNNDVGKTIFNLSFFFFLYLNIYMNAPLNHVTIFIFFFLYQVMVTMDSNSRFSLLLISLLSKLVESVHNDYFTSQRKCYFKYLIK